MELGQADVVVSTTLAVITVLLVAPVIENDGNF
jgi:hypothetical protein